MTKPIGIPPPETALVAPSGGMVLQWWSPLQRLFDAVNTLRRGPVAVPYQVATVPSAAGAAGLIIFVTNEVGGPVPAFSDGTDWRRSTDRQVISA
jgi:hypothetical protein